MAAASEHSSTLRSIHLPVYLSRHSQQCFQIERWQRFRSRFIAFPSLGLAIDLVPLTVVAIKAE